MSQVPDLEPRSELVESKTEDNSKTGFSTSIFELANVNSNTDVASCSSFLTQLAEMSSKSTEDDAKKIVLDEEIVNDENFKDLNSESSAFSNESSTKQHVDHFPHHNDCNKKFQETASCNLYTLISSNNNNMDENQKIDGDNNSTHSEISENLIDIIYKPENKTIPSLENTCKQNGFEDFASGYEKSTKAVRPSCSSHTSKENEVVDTDKYLLNFPEIPNDENDIEDYQHQLSPEATCFIGSSTVLENVIESQPPIDTVIICKDGRIGAHRIVLSAASPFMGHLLEEQKFERKVVLVLPDISEKVMKILLNLCYKGEMVFPEILQSEIWDAMVMLGVGETAKELMLSKVKIKVEPEPIPTTSAQPIVTQTSEIPTSLTQSSTFTGMPNPTPCTTETRGSDDDTETESENGDGQSENSELLRSISQGILLSEGKIQCCKCGVTLSSKQNFVRHIKDQHHEDFLKETVSFEEVETLSFCSICNELHKSFKKAQDCYSSHNYKRCITCLGVYPANDIINHCKEAHGIVTKHGKATKCRWCSLLIPISNNAVRATTHAMFTHIPLSSISKGQDSHSKSVHDKPKSVEKSKTKEPLPYHPIFERCKRNQEVAVQPCQKRRKLDDDGNPIHLAKRTGKPVGKNYVSGLPPNIVLPEMKYNSGIFSVLPDPVTKTLKDFKIFKLPKVFTHVHYMKTKEIETFFEKNDKKKLDKESKVENSNNEPQEELNEGIDNDIRLQETVEDNEKVAENNYVSNYFINKSETCETTFYERNANQLEINHNHSASDMHEPTQLSFSSDQESDLENVDSLISNNLKKTIIREDTQSDTMDIMTESKIKTLNGDAVSIERKLLRLPSTLKIIQGQGSK